MLLKIYASYICIVMLLRVPESFIIKTLRFGRVKSIRIVNIPKNTAIHEILTLTTPSKNRNFKGNWKTLK